MKQIICGVYKDGKVPASLFFLLFALNTFGQQV